MRTRRILIVDDDSHLLDACRRSFRQRYDIETALGPREGLAALAERGPWAVVVSDLRMPDMDGIQFLSRVRELAPETVRIMLTGHADLAAAVDGVNRGNIFRFLMKPVEHELFATTLDAALEQNRLITAERELLEKTLHGSLKALSEVLALVSPMSFSRSARVRRIVRHMALRLHLPEMWQYEVAAMLSQIGCVALPPGTIQRVYSGLSLAPEETRAFLNHPAVAVTLLGHIPRLELVAQMIGLQRGPFRQEDCGEDIRRRNPAVLGGQMLRVALELDQLTASGATHDQAIALLLEKPADFDPQLVHAAEKIEEQCDGIQVRSLAVSDLVQGMILDAEVRARNGLLLVPRGQEVTPAVIERLNNFRESVGVIEPIKVLVPKGFTQPASGMPGGIS